MVKRSSRYKSAKRKTLIKVNLNFSKIFLILFSLGLIGYLVYAYIEFTNVKILNPLRSGDSVHYLLKRYPDDFKKTLVVFENTYEGEDRIEKAYLYAYNGEKEMSVLIYIPNWVLYTGLESDFGSAVAISGFRYAGDFIQPGRGIEYAVWQFEEMLGMKVDDYIWFDAKAYLSFQENLGEVENNTSYSQYYENGTNISDEVFFINGFVSNLNWFNLFFSASKFRDSSAVIYSSYFSLPQVVVELKRINSGVFNLKPFVIDLGSSEYILAKESEDGIGISNYLVLSKYDALWRERTERMHDRDLERERVRVEVYNGSGISGEAYSFARKIANSGCEVVRFDNAPSRESNTKFYVPNKGEFENSYRVITDLFPGTYELIEGRPSFMTTGDIVVILGEDISSMFSF